jgi:hypothetical protein
MTAEEYAASLPKKKMKFKKKKAKKDKKNKRTLDSDDDDEEMERNQPMGSILDELDQTAVKSNKKRKRRGGDNGDDNDEESDSQLLHAGDVADAAKRRARFDEIMEKGNQQSEAAFKPSTKEETKVAHILDEEAEPDDNFLNEA